MINKQTQFKWLGILAISAITLILRVIDFVYEAMDMNFHMTRAGMEIMGVNAFVFQLAIIFICGFFMWQSFEKLSYFQLNYSIK